MKSLRNYVQMCSPKMLFRWTMALMEKAVLLERVKLQVIETAPDSQLFNLASICRLITVLMRPMTVVSSANIRSLTEGSFEVQSFMYGEKSSGERTHPWGAPVLIVRVGNPLTDWVKAQRAGSVYLREDQAWWYRRPSWSSQIRSLRNSQVCWGVARCNAVTCWLHHSQTCLLCRQTGRGSNKGPVMFFR